MKKAIVFLHGAWFGSWVWSNLIHVLKEDQQEYIYLVDKTYDFVNINLPNHAPFFSYRKAKDITFDECMIHIHETISKFDKVIIFAHSMSGIFLTALCDDIPEKIEKAVYVSAFLPAHNTCLFDYAKTDANSIVGKHIYIEEKINVVKLNNDCIRNAFFNATNDENTFILTNLTMELITPEHLSLFTHKIQLSNRFKKVNKYYIMTCRDNAITLDLQKNMLYQEDYKGIKIIYKGIHLKESLKGNNNLDHCFFYELHKARQCSFLFTDIIND